MIQRKLVVLSFLSLRLFLAKETAFAEAIRVGIPGLSAEFAPVWAARDKGLLKKYNLDTEVIAMQGGTQLVQAMIGGSLDFAVMGGAYLTGAVKGADLVMIATHMDKFPYSLIVKPAIKRTEDLKGTRLAISRFGSSSDAGLRVSLQRSGINPDKDVTILQVGGQTERYAALKAGSWMARSLYRRSAGRVQRDLQYDQARHSLSAGGRHRQSAIYREAARYPATISQRLCRGSARSQSR